ncbi:hypothetical protein L7F22_041572 [Adiantum nelumboides]|nr:hypothetical protein [Adiantum nelumboides]
MENASEHTHHDDAISVHNWVADNIAHTFYYQPMNGSDDDAFILGIQTRWQLEMFSKYGHNSLLAMDATFGTNKYKFHLYTILVFDAFRNGLPIAWTITSSSCRSNIKKWLIALRNRVLDYNKGWDPNAFMVDDAEAEIQALREVFGIPILLCIWHVRRAWLKNLVKKVPNPIVRADMFRQLGQIMNMRGKPCRSSYEKESQAHKLVEDFMVKYKDEDLFINYFKHEWLPRLGMWIRASRMMEHANQETNGSIEAYHGILKSKFLCGRRTIHGRRVDWLIKRLLCSCHSYFWYQEMLKDAGFKRNFAIMDVVKNSLARALEIPDEYVRFHGDDPKHAKVLSLSKQLHFYTVLNADVEWATCNCDWAIRGNLCKHQVKVMILASIDAQTIIDKGLSMYSRTIEDGHKSTIEPTSPLSAVGPVEEVDLPAMTNNFCNVETSHEELLAHIQSTILQTLHIAGDDKLLLQHIHRSSMQILTSVQQMKASGSCMPIHPCGELQQIEDAFGTSLKRKKSFIEKGCHRKRNTDKEKVKGVTSFPVFPQRKRITMQKNLDQQVGMNEE